MSRRTHRSSAARAAKVRRKPRSARRPAVPAVAPAPMPQAGDPLKECLKGERVVDALVWRER